MSREHNVSICTTESQVQDILPMARNKINLL